MGSVVASRPSILRKQRAPQFSPPLFPSFPLLPALLPFPALHEAAPPLLIHLGGLGEHCKLPQRVRVLATFGFKRKPFAGQPKHRKFTTHSQNPADLSPQSNRSAHLLVRRRLRALPCLSRHGVRPGDFNAIQLT